jgi:flagellar biosynthesis anti-sigma factor FlgM
MRVDENNPTNQVSSSASRAAESQRVQVDSGATSGTGSASAGDRVDLSSLTGRISQTMQSLASQSAQKVSQLKKDFSAGRYNPNAQQIAGAMARS